MSYQIQYESAKNDKYPMRLNRKRPGLLMYTAIAVIIGLIMSVPKLHEYLIPGDPDVTSAAFSQLVSDMQSGESFGDAVTAFCREIITNAE